MCEYLHVSLISKNFKITSTTYSGPEVLTCVLEVMAVLSFYHM